MTRVKSRVLFSHVSVFDGTGASCYPGTVLIEDERIAALAPPGKALAADGALEIDGGGATLMPGLVEGHAHLSWPSSVGHIVNTMRLPAEEHLLTTAYNARVLLDHGFTSAYSAGSLGERFEIALRNEINAGRLPGPRLRASCVEKGAEGVMGVPAAHDAAHARGVEGLRSEERRV